MPIPNPSKKEKKSEFISRCISELAKDSKFKENDQRIAVCYKQWSDASKQAGGSVYFENEEILLDTFKLNDQETSANNF